MRTRAFAIFLASSVAAASLPANLPSAFAQGMDADTKEAKSLFEDGVKLYKSGKFEEARVKFKAAYGLKKRPSIVLNLANAELQTKRPLDAVAHYKELIGMADAKADDKAEAQAGLAEAKKQIAVVVVDAPTGTTVVLDGENRQVPVDGEIYVMPGAHTIVVKLAKEIVDKPNLVAGQVYSLGAKTEPAPPPPVAPPPPPVAPAPPPAPAEPPPSAVTAPLPSATPALAPTPSPVQKDTGARPFLDGVHPVTYVSAGVAVVAAVGWIAFYFNAKTHDENTQKLLDAYRRPTCGPGVVVPCTNADHKAEKQAQYKQQGLDEIDAADRARNLSIVSGIVAGVAAAGAVVTYFVLRKPSQPKVGFASAPTYGGATFSLVGTF